MSPIIAAFASRWRLLTVLAIVAALTAAMYYRSLPQVPLVPAGVLPQITMPSQPGKPVMPKGYQPELAVRDPFAVPAEFLAKQQLMPGAAQPKNATGERQIRQTEIMPVLTGVIMSGNIGSAIIQYGADSRSYRRGDYVGPYQIVAISNSYVTLHGPGGRLTLGLGR
jgi:Tfp pilus assembly protein PilP